MLFSILAILILVFLSVLIFGTKFKPIRGYGQGDLPVLAGLDAVVKLEGKVIGWATNISFDESFELMGVRTLGYHGDRGYRSQGYTCSISVGTFVLQANVNDALPVPTRQTILTCGMVSFELVDLVTGKTLYLLNQCKCDTASVSFDSGSLATKNTNWKCREAIPMAVSGIQS